ncbi:hypothetical protein DL93DRAFT_2093078 [Clavulina sp. PMI_390]|nr:hypothetical protein DL93DRAFT_2093078 [Clavulina sp. PMI_390]
MTESFPRPEKTLKSQIEAVRDGSKLLSLPLPSGLNFPDLPSPARDPASFFPGYIVTTHIIPGAFPRSSYLEPRKWAQTQTPIVDDSNTEFATKSDRQEWVQRKRAELIEREMVLYGARVKRLPEDGRGLQDGPGPVMWTVMNRYARVSSAADKADRRIGLTVLAFHANGYHKETFEPIFRCLIDSCNQPGSRVRIDEFWSFDAAHTGDSALVNRNALQTFGEYAADGIDFLRDILGFVDHYLPATTGDISLPVHLTPHNDSISLERRYSKRIIVGMGHSFGASVLARVACLRPTLIRSMTLVEPVMFHSRQNGSARLIQSALSRRERWASRRVKDRHHQLYDLLTIVNYLREEAMEFFVKNPFFAAWDPEPLDLYVKYALYDTDDGAVQLKMPRFQEALSAVNTTGPMEVWDSLERLSDQVRLRWVVADRSGLGTVEDMQHMVWRRTTNSTNVILPGTHLLPQESPDRVASEIFVDWNKMAQDWFNLPERRAML